MLNLIFYLTFLTNATDSELAEVIRQAVNEIRSFKWMYAAIWIPMFTVLILVSYLGYKITRQYYGEETVILDKELYNKVKERTEDVDEYVNKIVKKSLKGTDN